MFDMCYREVFRSSHSSQQGIGPSQLSPILSLVHMKCGVVHLSRRRMVPLPRFGKNR